MIAATIERDRQLAEGRRAQVAERRRQVEQRLGLDDAVLQAGQHDRHAEGHDEPVQPALHDQQAVDQADRGADGDQHHDAEVRAEVGAVAVGGDRHDQPGRDHRRQAEGGLQRQVHAADHQDQALADHDHAERGALLADAGEVRDGQERGADHGPDDDQQHQHGQQRHLAQHADVHGREPRADGAPGGGRRRLFARCRTAGRPVLGGLVRDHSAASWARAPRCTSCLTGPRSRRSARRGRRAAR